jgi:hypothetical protein
VTISGTDNAEQRMAAVDRFQNDSEVRVAACNIIAGGVGITLTAGNHVIFQDLDWVPANHLQAEDRAYRLGQTDRVTVEYMFADDTLDVYIAELLEAKHHLINTIESEELPNPSVLDELYAKLRSLGPALLQGVAGDGRDTGPAGGLRKERGHSSGRGCAAAVGRGPRIQELQGPQQGLPRNDAPDISNAPASVSAGAAIANTFDRSGKDGGQLLDARLSIIEKESLRRR